MRHFILAALMTITATAHAATMRNSAPRLVQSQDTITWTDSLQDVSVTAKRPLVKMTTDKMSYHVSDDAEAKSATVLDMLKKVPMVTVDAQDNITVNGSSSFKVYVDGKPNPMFSSNASKIFKAMPAAMVKDIEVITNPGAKYDAEGTTGILNIVMNKVEGKAGQDLRGFTGNISATIHNKGDNESAFVSGQEGKFSYSVNVTRSYQHISDVEVDLKRTQLTDGMTTDMHTNVRQKQPFYALNISLGYEIDSLNSISAYFGGSKWKQRQWGDYNTTVRMPQLTEPYSYTDEGYQRPKNDYYSASADYTHTFRGNKRRKLILSWLLGDSPSKTYKEDRYSLATIPSTNALNKAKGVENTFQADYTEPISETQTLNMGMKYILRRNTSKADSYVLTDGVPTLIDDATLDYSHHDDILAAYLEHKGTFGSLSTTAGLRYEYTWQNVEFKKGAGEDFTKHYGNLVPSASLSYSFGGGMQNIGVKYNMRISRPGIYTLNPYRDMESNTGVSYGNVHLKTTTTHNLGLVYNLFTQKIMINMSLNQSFSNDGLTQYSFYADNLLNTTWMNGLHQRNSSLTAFINYNISPKTRLMMQMNALYTHLQSYALGESNHGWGGSGFIGWEQTLPWKLKMSLNLNGSLRSYSLEGHSSGTVMSYATLSKSLFKDKLTLSLFGLSPLKDGGKMKFKNIQQGRDYINHMSYKVPLQIVGFTVSYNFGNANFQPRQHQSNIQNDFQETKKDGSIMGM